MKREPRRRAGTVHELDEPKLSRTVSDDDVRQLLWLQERIGDDLLDAFVSRQRPCFRASHRPSLTAVN